MGGVLYSATRAVDNRDRQRGGVAADRVGGLSPVQSGITTFVAPLLGGLVPLAPFMFLPLEAAVAVSITLSLLALFALGSWTGRVSGAVWWRDGFRLLLVASVAAVAAAVMGTVLRVE